MKWRLEYGVYALGREMILGLVAKFRALKMLASKGFYMYVKEYGWYFSTSGIVCWFNQGKKIYGLNMRLTISQKDLRMKW